MIIDGVRLTDTLNSFAARNPAVTAFLAYIERKLNVVVLKEHRNISWGIPELEAIGPLADTLKRRGIVETVRPIISLPDEPQIKRWEATCGGESAQLAGGASFRGHSPAYLAMIAEALERYIWTEKSDYFKKPLVMSPAEIRTRYTAILPERFAAFTDEQRASRNTLTLDPHASYLWIAGESLITKKPIYMPAQTVSGIHGLRTQGGRNEPLIRPPITTGLATWPDATTARMKGALEVIERDAYMIMWLNQLTCPRISLSTLRQKSVTLRNALESCERYGLKVHAVRMVTDAPTYAICVVVEDLYTHEPRFSFGLKSGPRLAETIEGAIVEALRGRSAYRKGVSLGIGWYHSKLVQEVGHIDRIYYWGSKGRAEELEFLICGAEVEPKPEAWDDDTPAQHLSRIVTWCAQRGYECVSVSLSTKENNPLPWAVEMVVIPELQPTHLSEKNPRTGGSRLHSVPASFGYVPRAPYLDAPHPFA